MAEIYNPPAEKNHPDTTVNTDLLSRYVDCVILEADASVPIQIQDTAEIIRIEGGPDKTIAAVLQHQESRRVLVVVASPRSFKLVKAINDVQNQHMAIWYDGQWDADEITRELLYLDNLLVNDDGQEYCIGAEILPDIFFSEDGRVLLKNTEYSEQQNIRLYKKNTHAFWGLLLTDDIFSQKHLLGQAGQASGNITERILLMQDILQQTEQHQKDELPVFDSILVFSGGRCLISKWVHTYDKDSFFCDFCFHILFGTEYASCPDVMKLLIEQALSDKIPDFFLDDLEAVYLHKKIYSFQKWNVIFRHLVLVVQED
ncbi:MAG: hypothetical protein E7496_05565 [Ruminococcus sp.]|nr:hypothetical protein [Ruminococcus sp.]